MDPLGTINTRVRVGISVVKIAESDTGSEADSRNKDFLAGSIFGISKSALYFKLGTRC